MASRSPASSMRSSPRRRRSSTPGCSPERRTPVTPRRGRAATARRARRAPRPSPRARAAASRSRPPRASHRCRPVSRDWFQAMGVGVVDPTLGVAIEAAGYDRDFAELTPDPRPPAPAVPGSWRHVRVAGRLVFRYPGTKLDLNCIVKGLAVDAALDLLEDNGFVSAGGDVAVRGSAVVGLPGDESLTLTNGGLATSGTTRRRWERGGEPQHHLINPRTGRPSSSRWSEVTVAAGSCLEADVAAKAAFLLSEDGPAWLDDRALAGRFREGDQVVLNAAWQAALMPAQAA